MRHHGQWFVIHTESHNVFRADECVVIDLGSNRVDLAIGNGLDGDDYYDDENVSQAGECFGVSLSGILQVMEEKGDISNGIFKS